VAHEVEDQALEAEVEAGLEEEEAAGEAVL
jgi:hypothetical protein